mgnify:FL=1
MQAMLSSDHDNYLSQSGSVRSENSRVYIFPKETLPALEVLGKNDLLKLIITKNGDVEQEGVIPLHNYRRAKNWAYSIQ